MVIPNSGLVQYPCEPDLEFYHPEQLLILLLTLAYWDVPFLAVAALAGAEWRSTEIEFQV